MDNIGADWLADEISAITDHIERISPTEYNEQNRYLPEYLTPLPGYIRFDVNPYMKEIIDAFDPDSPVREVSVMKGAQITFTTVGESVLLYYIGKVKTAPCLYVSADSELAAARVDGNILPMLQESGMADLIQSLDGGSRQKTGSTKDHLQWKGGGQLKFNGAKNAAKARQYSALFIFKDEMDGWPDVMQNDGDGDSLTDSRAMAFWERRKILRGSTPVITQTSKILKAYQRGDQREYRVLCRGCGFPQKITFREANQENGIMGGFTWETEGGVLIVESVQWRCRECGHGHANHEKSHLFSPENGAHWFPTATAVSPGVRSYHLPAFYSPAGMMPWHKVVTDYLEAWDESVGKPKSPQKWQVFENNVMGIPHTLTGAALKLEQLQAHRRDYFLGQVPNKFAEKYSGSPILMLTMHVDVHDAFLAVGVFGWCDQARCYLIDYWHMTPGEEEREDCSDPNCSVWRSLSELVEGKGYVADDGRKYKIVCTTVDAGYKPDTVSNFCAQYEAGVAPTIGVSTLNKYGAIKEFATYQTQAGQFGYKITVNPYKDRISSALRRGWVADVHGTQGKFQFNFPVDLKDARLAEYCGEMKTEVEDARGVKTVKWERVGANELLDLTVYGHATVDILAVQICRTQYGADSVRWDDFWRYLRGSIYFEGPPC